MEEYIDRSYASFLFKQLHIFKYDFKQVSCKKGNILG